ncbi:MAG: 1-acyl-sn-glycerol-3-phosphate acyltransferase [Phycisphaerales bacterium]|nr:MAG: 1-acyl-sn-glycerol-3-phosphate acyltransferase [Phycisphaerales bacterium]
MSAANRVQAPTTAEIEKRFRHPAVHVARPVIWGGIGVLRTVRRFKWTARGAERLYRYESPLIFAANHCSHADTAAILGTLPRYLRKRTAVAAALDVFGPARYVPKKTLKWFRREMLQFIVAGGFRAFAFDRHGAPHRSLRTASDLVDNGWNLILYPEGTRSRSGEMATFKPGVGLLARRTRRPVVPIHVCGGASILRCGQFMPSHGHAFVRYGRPLEWQKGESAEVFTTRIEEAVRRLAVANEQLALSPPAGKIASMLAHLKG